jgi:hypothetical protein
MGTDIFNEELFDIEHDSSLDSLSTSLRIPLYEMEES